MAKPKKPAEAYKAARAKTNKPAVTNVKTMLKPMFNK
jgi:hypothetical protein